MTRKHFIMLASVIAKIEDKALRETEAKRVAVVCKEANKHFNFDRFYTACGVN